MATRRFRLDEGEPVPAGLRRIADSQLDMSIERLEGETDEDLGTVCSLVSLDRVGQGRTPAHA
jgi:hypothetical protein